MSDSVFVGTKAGGLETSPQFEPISKIILLVDSENYYEAGNDTGRTLEITCPYGTQAMANNLLSSLGGYAYQPATATDALIDPAAELGDAVTVGGIYTVLAQMDTTFDSLMTADIGAPGQEEIESEYPYVSQQQSDINRQIAQTRSEISKTSEEIGLRVDGLENQYAQLKVTIDGVTIEGPGGTTLIDGGKIDADELHVNAANIDGTLSANQINMTGSITWSDLASDAQGKVNSAQSTATSAQTTANNAQNTANSVSNRVAGWTYPGSTQINGSSIMTGTVTASTIRGGSVQLLDGSGWSAGTLSLTSASSSSYSVQFASGAAMRLKANGGVVWLESSTGAYLNVAANVVVGTNLQPAGDNNYTCGVSGARWADIYSANSVINVSDRREKTDIAYDLSAYDAAFDSLKPASFKFVNGTSGRTHTGFISQDIEDALEPSGLTSTDFAAFIKSPLTDKSGTIIQGEYRYGIRYEELIALCVAQIQALKKRVSELEKV